MIALDTGYNAYETFGIIDAIDELKETDAPQPDEVVQWLNETLRLGDACGADKRGLVFMSHHQPFSDFVKDDAYLGTPEQLAELVPKDCTVLWLTGHEHEFALYSLTESFGVSKTVDLSVYHRLIGNGGFPQPPQKPSKHTTLKAYDNRAYKTFELNGDKQEAYVYNGYFTLELDGANLLAKYYTTSCESEAGEDGSCPVSEGPSMTSQTLVGEELFAVDQDGRVALVSQELNSDVLTIIEEGGEVEMEKVKKVRQRYAFQHEKEGH